MELRQLSLIIMSSVLFLADFAESELPQECKEMKEKCDSSYLVDANPVDGSKKILCSDMKAYTGCIHGMDCGITKSQKLTIIDHGMEKFEGVICDYSDNYLYNSTIRPCSISIMIVLITAVLMFFKY